MNIQEQILNLIKQADEIKSKKNAVDYKEHIEKWMGDVSIINKRQLKNHELHRRLNTAIFHKKFEEVVGLLTSISQDEEFSNAMNQNQSIQTNTLRRNIINKEYDVFISHANADKEDFIDDLYKSLSKLDINIFYDKQSLKWGDKWKDKILNGVQQSEFAIIVISENFFDREWTERELVEFLSRQNQNGQKIILPVLKNISIDNLQEKYPAIANIQTINKNDHSVDEIALLFAQQLIQRLKHNY